MKNFKSLVTGLVCPACESDSAVLQQRMTTVENVGKMLRITLSCAHCFHHENDFIPLFKKEPSRIEFSIEDENDLDAKVVKSNTCKLKIPELDLEVDPDPEAASVISNVDEVLNRIRFHSELSYDYKTIESAITNARRGKRKLTLILEDPTGVSTIISKKVKRHLL